MDQRAAPPSSPRRLRCYVVEDSPIIRQNLIATLEEMLEVDVVGFAEDEAGAVGWIRGDDVPCDLMIIDLFLKSGTGLEVLRHAREQLENTRLAVLTNYATAEMRRRCEALGADRVFDKSAELEELLAYCDELAAHLNAGRAD
jgi:DNA-binding NarL/FixJ family response regulator